VNGCAAAASTRNIAAYSPDVWAKLWGNMNMNPLSALTRCGTSKILADPDVVSFAYG